MDIEAVFNLHSQGAGTQPMVFAHGFGCNQSMWRWVAPAFEPGYRVILFDLAGSGQSQRAAYDSSRHSTLNGYARDVLNIVRGLDLHDVIFVGHSVSAMIGALAAIDAPDRFARLIMVGPSPCYINDDGYVGGFSRGDIDGLIDALDSNYLGWASTLAPIIMGTPDRPELVHELENSFCLMDPLIARAFAKVTFLSDSRSDLARVETPCLVIQVSHDVIAPVSVGRFVHHSLRDSELVVLETRGHCPHLSAPKATVAAMKAFLERST